MHTLSEAAHILGCSDPRHLTKCMQIAGIDAATLPEGAHDKRQRLLTDAQMEQLRAAYAQLFGPKQHAPSSSVELHAILERLEAIEQDLATLKERSPWLFSRVTRSEPNLTEQSTLPIREAIPAPQRRPSASTVRRSAPGDFPASARGRGKWVEEHGGPGASWVRDWPDILSWQGPEDAITSVRRKRGYEHWEPTT